MVNTMRAFGTKGYGNADGFRIICNRCGREARIIPIHHYKELEKFEKMTLEYRCICGNKYGVTVHD